MTTGIHRHLVATIGRSARILPVLAALFAGGVAHAQTWPAPGKPVRIVVPFSPGGTTDLIGRVLAEQLAKSTGGQFIVDSKPGGGGAIGSMEVARAVGDGHTLLIGTSSTHSVAPAMNPKLRYDAVKDFTPLAHLADSDLIMLASRTIGVTNVKELLALARERPGYINYTSSGVGTIAHLYFEAFKAQAGVVLTHIPYKGTGGAIGDLTSGVVHLSLDAVATGAPHLTDGRLRGLATTGPHRSALTPNIEAVNETLKGFSVVYWFGLYGPKNMSPDLVQRINEEVTKVMKVPEMQQRYKAWAVEQGRGSAADFGAMVAADTARWSKLVKERNIKPD